jgi:hypothetical protein
MTSKIKSEETNLVKSEVKFTKIQILASEKYADRRDLLSALLDDSEEYSGNEIDKILKNFLRKKAT